MKYQLRLKAKGYSTFDLIVEAPGLPRVGDTLDLGEFDGVLAITGKGAFGEDPPSTFWVEVIHRSFEPNKDAQMQLQEVDPVLVVAKSWA